LSVIKDNKAIGKDGLSVINVMASPALVPALHTIDFDRIQA